MTFDDIHLKQQQTIDGAVFQPHSGQESKVPPDGEPTGRFRRDGLSAAPSPVIAGPQPIVTLLDALPPDPDEDPDWDELTARVATVSPSVSFLEFVERMLDRMDA